MSETAKMSEDVCSGAIIRKPDGTNASLRGSRGFFGVEVSRVSRGVHGSAACKEAPVSKVEALSGEKAAYSE